MALIGWRKCPKAMHGLKYCTGLYGRPTCFMCQKPLEESND